MAILYRDITIQTAISVNMLLIDVVRNESSERLKIYTIPLVTITSMGTEGLQTIKADIRADSKVVTSAVQVRWLLNCT